MFKLRKISFSIIFNLTIFFILMIGIQNSSTHKKVNLLIGETIRLPVGFIIGVCFGSFFNVVIYRLPLNLSIVKPRSFCPKCKSKISWRENIPLLSWLIQKGQCLNCGKKISFKYPLIEFLTGLSFIALSFSSPEIHQSINNKIFLNISSWIFFSIVFLISLIDIRHFWIPQKLINFGFLFGTFNFLLVKFDKVKINSSYTPCISFSDRIYSCLKFGLMKLK